MHLYLVAAPVKELPMAGGSMVVTARPFRRYTNLAGAIHLLQNRTITLLNPATWDDKNDAYFMSEYKRLKKAMTVNAICFAECAETYHHWRVFSHGADGVCLIFKKAELLSTFENDSRISSRPVEYKMIAELNRMRSLSVNDLPFFKRTQFRDEKEYRVVYTDINESEEYTEYNIELDWIKQVVVSPWVSKPLADAISATLKSIKGCSKLSVVRSELVSTEAWRAVTTKAI